MVHGPAVLADPGPLPLPGLLLAVSLAGLLLLPVLALGARRLLQANQKYCVNTK